MKLAAKQFHVFNLLKSNMYLITKILEPDLLSFSIVSNCLAIFWLFGVFSIIKYSSITGIIILCSQNQPMVDWVKLELYEKQQYIQNITNKKIDYVQEKAHGREPTKPARSEVTCMTSSLSYFLHIGK